MLEHIIRCGDREPAEASAEIGGFRVFFSEDSDLPALNYARPIRASEDWIEDLQRLAAIFLQHRRPTRLEVVAGLWPNLSWALRRRGWLVWQRLVMMGANESQFRPPLEPCDSVRAVHLDLTTPASTIARLLAAEADAFGFAIERLGPAPIDKFRGGMADGQLSATGLYCAGPSGADECVAGAAVIGGPEIGELTNVWVQPAWRRRGLGRLVAGLALARFFSEGGRTATVSAKRGSERLYAGLGFSPVGPLLIYGLP